MSDVIKRCQWVSNDPIYTKYHDKEWGIPVYSDKKLFEMMILEGAQAGLSWITILKKRAHYRKVFDGFDARKIAGYNQKKIDSLLLDPGIVRNKLKVESTISNAKLYLELKEKHGRFSDFLWEFVDGEPIQNKWRSLKQVPVSTDASDAMSKELKRRGFKFIGTTICYAFMQSVGMVNDHTTDCFCHDAVSKLGKGS